MNLPKVSVIMSVYNGARYLREAIDSILGQTYTDFEFLIIIDGSIDNSVDIIESYGDPRIRLFHNKTNLGLTKALNKGLRLARGEYIARMDADDISLPQRLEKQIEFLDRDRDVGICGTFIKTIGSVDGIWEYPMDDAYIRSKMIFANSFAHSSVLLRASILKEHKIFYDESFRFSQDYELWVRLSSYTKLANLKDILVFHRTHKESVGTVHNGLQEDTASRVRLAQINKLGIYPCQEEIILHNDLSNRNFKNQQDFVQASRNWLQKLHKTNCAMKYYQELAFTNVLAERWYMVCRRAQKLGPWTWKTFWSSPLSSFTNLPLKNKIGFASKCILRVQ